MMYNSVSRHFGVQQNKKEREDWLNGENGGGGGRSPKQCHASDADTEFGGVQTER